ncbi:MAG: hypothetical protein JW870_15385, partial [Candidatus Delongbacteria bacterium]|nr:hypothetical protein [Candidatus Delongbacteria bacterium]
MATHITIIIRLCIYQITTVRLKYFSNYKPSEIKRFNDITLPTGLKLSPLNYAINISPLTRLKISTVGT